MKGYHIEPTFDQCLWPSSSGRETVKKVFSVRTMRLLLHTRLWLQETHLEKFRSKPICLHTCNFLSTHELDPYFPIQEKSYSVVPRVTISAQNLINLKSHTLTQSWEKPFIYTVQVLLHKTRKPQETHAFIFRRNFICPQCNSSCPKAINLKPISKGETFLKTALRK